VIALSELSEIIDTLHSFEGISRKLVIPDILRKLRQESYKGDTPHSLGEDSAAIGTECDEFVLLTTDAIVEELCLNHPHAAGFNAVLANIMDIYAAGGVPTSFAVALSYSDRRIGDELLEGLIEGSRTFRVPIVRGHTNPASSSTYIVGSATGTVAKKELLTAGGAEEGDVLLLLFDRTGKRGSSYIWGFDAVTGRKSEEVVKRLTVMRDLAKRGLLNASKDISVAGLVGTAGMLLEYSGKGGEINLDVVDAERPKEISLKDWLRMYISLCFLVSTHPHNITAVNKIAAKHQMDLVHVGKVDSSLMLFLALKGERQLMFDFSKGPVLTPKDSPR
jgi:selenophosphate synthetase-related protein